MDWNELNDKEKAVIEDKGTEMPFTGEYDNFYKPGTYVCRRCNNPLYSSKTKFDARCGWPAFDDHFPGAVDEHKEPHSPWSEIDCANCHGHLGHVFRGEGFTDTDTRHCVNSLSIRFVPD
jgi:peptide-methionine (R)-S-oxide reductase